MFLFCFVLFETCYHCIAQTCLKLSVVQAGLKPTIILFYLQKCERDATTHLTAFYLLCVRPAVNAMCPVLSNYHQWPHRCVLRQIILLLHCFLCPILSVWFLSKKTCNWEPFVSFAGNVHWHLYSKIFPQQVYSIFSSWYTSPQLLVTNFFIVFFFRKKKA